MIRNVVGLAFHPHLHINSNSTVILKLNNLTDANLLNSCEHLSCKFWIQIFIIDFTLMTMALSSFSQLIRAITESQ